MEIMSLFRRIFGGSKLDGAALADSSSLGKYAQIDLLSRFVDARPLDNAQTQQQWTRVLPQSYEQTIKLFLDQGWLEATGTKYQVTSAAIPFIESYQARLERGTCTRPSQSAQGH